METNNALYFIAGALVGSIGTYMLVKKKFEKEYNEYRSDLADIYNKSGEAQTKDETEELEETNDIVNRINTLVGSNSGEKREVVQYDNMYNDTHDTTYQEENDIEQKKSILESNESADFPSEDDKPYIISEEEYADPIPAVDKVTLKYFIRDDILIDEATHEVSDVGATVDESNIRYIIDNELDLVYVRNENNGTDYEVEVDDRDYEEVEKAYLGIF